MRERKHRSIPMNDGQIMDDQLYTRPEAAEILGCSLNFLAKDAMKQKPMIQFVKLSPKFVRYRGSEIKRIMNAQPGHQATH